MVRLAAVSRPVAVLVALVAALGAGVFAMPRAASNAVSPAVSTAVSNAALTAASNRVSKPDTDLITKPAVGLAAPGAAVRAVSQVLHVPGADITFTGARTPDGGFEVEGQSQDFLFRKKVYANGYATIDIQAGTDKTTITLDGSMIRLTHGKKSKTIIPGAATEDDADEGVKLLAESRAVRVFRGAAAAVTESGDDSASALAMVTSDALIGQLTGDAGARNRLANRFKAQSRRNPHTVALTTSCFSTWESGVNASAEDLSDCLESVSWASQWRDVCSFKWYIEVESLWWSFIYCTFR
jgi:hypothetical protein